MSGPECVERGIPAVVANDYHPIGDYIELDGVKTYATGSSSAKIAIIFMYDVFGFANQTFQGADMLSKLADALVLMPDVLSGGLPIDMIPVDTDEKKKRYQEFFSVYTMSTSDPVVARINSFAAAIKPNYPSVEKIGGLGLCYGGKVLILANNQPESIIEASAQGHPGKLAAEDAKQLRVPHLCLASNQENTQDVKAFDEVKKPAGSETHTFDSMHHGWMGARANLETSEENRAEFSRAYQMAGKWFKKVLGV